MTKTTDELKDTDVTDVAGGIVSNQHSQGHGGVMQPAPHPQGPMHIPSIPTNPTPVPGTEERPHR